MVNGDANLVLAQMTKAFFGFDDNDKGFSGFDRCFRMSKKTA